MVLDTMPPAYNNGATQSTFDTMNLTNVYSAYCSNPSQIPEAGDTWRNASVDTISDNVPGYVIVEDSGGTGRLDRFKFLKAGTYQVSISFEYVGIGGINSTAIIYGRRLLNGIQYGTTTASVMENFEAEGSYVLSRWFTFKEGDTLEYQFAYDASENPAGLQTKAVPAGLGANPSPCFSIRVDIP